MKQAAVILFILCMVIQAFSQNKPGQVPKGMPPGYLDQLKKNLPPGVKLTPEMMKMMQQAQGQEEAQSEDASTAGPLIQMPPVQQYSYTADPSPAADYSPFGSGRNEAQRRAALLAVETELNTKPFLLPKPESTPTKAYMLQMALERSKLAHQKFDPDDLSNYSRAVTWVPQFDGKHPDTIKARQYSLTLALATNESNKPHFITAFSAAVFALDPLSSSNANNFASAILSAGELLYPKKPNTESLAPYRRDAESGYLYAIAVSMKDSTWSEDSFTPIINFGNLCIDLGRLEEARSLFMVARKIKPESWDAALGLAAYFFALNQKDKALAILEDDNLDKPEKYLIPVKANKSLEKSEKFADLPPESPDSQYEEGIKIMAAEPISTAADFVTQLDQSERNKMRYFIEHLPVQGSYTAPPIKKLTQYSTVKAISSPQGVSALEDFSGMLGVFTLVSFASTTNTQLEWLKKFGLNIDPGVDMNDVAKHPEKYMDKNLKPDVKISGKEEFMAKMMEMKKDAEKARLDLATGKTTSITELAAKIDPMHAILLLNPDDFADPMNIIFQKMNYTVYNRKNNLYRGYLYSLNKKTYQIVTDEIEKYSKKIQEFTKIKDAEAEELKKQEEAARKQANATGSGFPEAEWKLRAHAIHVKYFNSCNNVAETGYGSATNIVSSFYMNKVKPTVEGYYYDVIRHVALISDPEVREKKEADLRNSMNQALTWYLQTVLAAHSAFRYSDEWDCGCDLEALLAQREAENKAIEDEEEARRERNKAARAVFDSGKPPESSPLFQKLDSYHDDYNFILFKVRASCARTTIEANEDILPFKYKSTENEFTGETKRTIGLKAGVSKKVGPAEVSANVNCDFNFTTDGNGVLKDYSVVPGAEGKVKVGNFNVSVKGNVTIGPEGVRDYSVTGSANASVKYGNTTVKGGASVTINSKGVESDFSAGIKQDLKNDFGGTAKVEMEASTKRGCSLSAEINHELDPSVQKAVNNAADKVENITGLRPDTDFMKKKTWSGKYQSKQP